MLLTTGTFAVRLPGGPSVTLFCCILFYDRDVLPVNQGQHDVVFEDISAVNWLLRYGSAVFVFYAQSCNRVAIVLSLSVSRSFSTSIWSSGTRTRRIEVDPSSLSVGLVRDGETRDAHDWTLLA